MAMPYRTGIDFGYKEEFDFSNSIEFPNESNFSYGTTMETSTRFSHDYTKASQSIARCRRLMATTYSVQYTLIRAETPDLFEQMGVIEDIVGKTGRLYVNHAEMGLVVVSSVTLAPEVCSDGISALGVSLELVQALEPKKRAKKAKISTVRRAS